MGNIVALVPDLFSQSKIAGVANQLGISVQCVRTAADARQALATAAALVVDLTVEDADLPGLIAEARAQSKSLRIVAFFPHVHADIGRAARAAGADPVLTRGQFIEQLPALLRALQDIRR